MMRTTRTFGRQIKPADLPKWFRKPPPALTSDQITTLGIVHHENVEQISKGLADVQLLWDWVGSILTWSRVAQITGNGLPEMQAQLDLTDVVIERFRRTGRVGFSGTELQLARDGCGYMDQLAEITPQPIAAEATDWSEARRLELATAVDQQMREVA